MVLRFLLDVFASFLLCTNYYLWHCASPHAASRQKHADPLMPIYARERVLFSYAEIDWNRHKIHIYIRKSANTILHRKFNVCTEIISHEWWVERNFSHSSFAEKMNATHTSTFISCYVLNDVMIRNARLQTTHCSYSYIAVIEVVLILFLIRMR